MQNFKLILGPIEKRYLKYVDNICKKTLEANPTADRIYIYARHAVQKLEQNQELDHFEMQSFFDVIGRFFQAVKLGKLNSLVTDFDYEVAKDLIKFAVRLEEQLKGQNAPRQET